MTAVRTFAPSPRPAELKLRGATFGSDELLTMAIVNRTPDSFYDRGATYAFEAALERVHQVVEEGAEIVDIGGVKAAPGEEVGVAEELRRTVEFVAAVRQAHPRLAISVDTWRHEVGRAVCEAGADLLNDAWGGWDPRLVEVAAEYGAAIVCTHAGGVAPRTRPHRTGYADLTANVLDGVMKLANRALEAGVDPASIIIDPAHDFAKNTHHSLEITRNLDRLVATGLPVLVSLSNKDFVGETLNLPLEERLTGTLAATAIAAWQGARIFRVHEAAQTRQTLGMVAAIRGTRAPALALRGLA
jgi:dihydropteroate synthase